MSSAGYSAGLLNNSDKAERQIRFGNNQLDLPERCDVHVRYVIDNKSRKILNSAWTVNMFSVGDLRHVSHGYCPRPGDFRLAVVSKSMFSITGLSGFLGSSLMGIRSTINLLKGTATMVGA